MKKTSLTLAIAIATCYSYAQTNSFPSSGNVGIGTTSPLTLFDVKLTTNQHVQFVPNVNNNYMGASGIVCLNDANTGLTPLGFLASNFYFGAGNVGIGTTTASTALQIGSFLSGGTNQLSIPGTYNFEQVRLGQIGNGNSALEFVNHTGVSNSYGIKFLVNVDGGAPGLQLQYAPSTSSYSGLAYTTGFYMDLSGNVAIGTTNNAGYKLAVNGSAIATSMTVKLNANWPDYVFKPNYTLPSLADVKTYIDKNQHLPEMPSEQEILKDGVNLGEMNRLLVKKVEELTLYLIEKDKELNDVRQASRQSDALITLQEEKIENMDSRLGALITALNESTK